MASSSFVKRSALPVLDVTVLTASFLGAVYLRLDQQLSSLVSYENVAAKTVVSVVALYICLYYSDVYERWPPRRPFDAVFGFVRAFAAGLLLLLTLYYAVPSLKVGRGILTLYLILAFVAIVSARGLYRWFEEEDAFADNVLVLGTGTTAQRVVREIQNYKPWGLRIIGFLGEDPAEVGRRSLNAPVVGTLEELPLLVGRLRTSLLIVALDDRRRKLPIRDLVRCRVEGIRIEEAATVLEHLTGSIPTQNLRPSLIVFSHGFHDIRLLKKVKYGGEFIMAAILLVILTPLMLLVSALVRLTSPGPVVYRQERVGERGRTFHLLKFRTMRVDAEAATGPVWASEVGDPRITPLGRLMRKTRLDELPQLFNVLRGEMSFVGPRPERPHFVNALREVLSLYDERHVVRPGITGWAQVKYGYGSSIEDAQAKLQYDLYYIKHASLGFDLSIVLDTLKVVLVGKGAR